MIIVSVTKEEARQSGRETDLVWGASDCVMEERVQTPCFYFNCNDRIVIKCILEKICLTDL